MLTIADSSHFEVWGSQTFCPPLSPGLPSFNFWFYLYRRQIHNKTEISSPRSYMENFSTNSCIKCGAQNPRSWPERERLRAQACSTRAGPIDNARSFVTSRAARKTEVSNTMRGLMWMEGKKQSVPLNQSNQFLYERKAECLLLLLRCERVSERPTQLHLSLLWIHGELRKTSEMGRNAGNPHRESTPSVISWPSLTVKSNLFSLWTDIIN